MSARLHTQAQKLGGGKRIFEPLDEVCDKDVELKTLVLVPDAWLVCEMNYRREKGHFSITRDEAIKS